MAGASGDKLLSAFVDAGVDHAAIQDEISKALVSANKAGFVRFQDAESREIHGLKMSTSLDDSRMGMNELENAIDMASNAVGLSEWGRNVARKGFEYLMSGEKEVHGDVHLHEIGEADTIVDLVGTAKAVEMLGLAGAKFYTAPVAVGCGKVEGAHGTMPVPAPATAKILISAGIPVAPSDILGELTTPTGAALLAALTGGAQKEGEEKVLVIKREGVGIGNHAFPVPNIARVFIGSDNRPLEQERLSVIETNVDDVTGEVLGWLQEKLQKCSEDVSVTPMITKKNRPGFCIRVVALPGKVEEAREALMNETGSLGVKVFQCIRYKVPRSLIEENFEICGRNFKVRIKRSEDGSRVKPEYEDLRRISLELEMPLRGVMEEVMRKLK